MKTRTKDDTEYVRCTAPFAVFNGPVPTVVGLGEVMPADSETVRRAPGNFVTVAEFERRAEGHRMTPVEQATARPGEKRNVTIPKAEVEPEVPRETAPEPEPEPASVPESASEPQAERDTRPADYAPKAVWLEYARDRGFDGDAGDTTKDELIRQYG